MKPSIARVDPRVVQQLARLVGRDVQPVTPKTSVQQFPKVSIPQSRNNTGIDDAVGRTLQRTGAVAAMIPDPVVFAAVLAVTKSPPAAAKAAVTVQVGALTFLGLGTLLRVID